MELNVIKIIFYSRVMRELVSIQKDVDDYPPAVRRFLSDYCKLIKKRIEILNKVWIKSVDEIEFCIMDIRQIVIRADGRGIGIYYHTYSVSYFDSKTRNDSELYNKRRTREAELYRNAWERLNYLVSVIERIHSAEKILRLLLQSVTIS